MRKLNQMKKVVLGLSILVAMASCSSNTSHSSGTLGTITKVAQISSAISEISNLLGGLNLTSAQSSLVKSALTTYINNYNKVDTTKANYQTLLDGYKTKALTDIKTSVGDSKYGQFISTLKSTTEKANNTSVSSATLGVISSLIK